MTSAPGMRQKQSVKPFTLCSRRSLVVLVAKMKNHGEINKPVLPEQLK